MGGLTALAVVVVAYTLVASKLDRWWITGPMVFVAAGAILGPGGLEVLPFALGNETVLTITELTLALVLFADASTVRLRDVEGDTGLPRRLLFVGLPLTIVAGAVLAYLMFPGVGWAAAALVATILAPTDAALGLAVVTNKAVPVRIRRALNVESGLNDGIATPFVTLFIAVVAAEEGLGDTAWGLEALKQIGLAIVAAVVVGYLGGKLLAVAVERGWTSGVSEQIAILALALLAYGGSVAIGGNGFIAAFAGGILFGAATRRRLAEPVQFTETAGLVGLLPGVVDLRRAVRRRAARAGTLSSTDRLRGTEPHRDQDGAGRDRAYRNASASGHRGIHGLVRPTRTRLGRLHAPRPGRDRTRRRRRDAPADRHLDHPALRGAARHLGIPAGGPVRGVDREGRRCPGEAPAGEPPIRLHDLAGRHHLGRQQARSPDPAAQPRAGADG